MKLFFTYASPYARKVIVTARELELFDAIELEYLRPVPTAPDATLSASNPLSKIPTLVLDDGTAIYDSSVICEYFCALVKEQTLLPKSGEARITALRRQALANGVLDAAVLIFQEQNLRPEALRWPDWISGQTAKVMQGLDAMEAEASRFGPGIDLGLIAMATAIGWLEFRKPLGDVRAGRPTLTAWYERFSQRPSMLATIPKVV